jgi:hypothetical protein
LGTIPMLNHDNAVSQIDAPRIPDRRSQIDSAFIDCGY